MKQSRLVDAVLETNQMFRDVIANTPNLTQLSQEDVKRIQKVLLMIMDDIDTVCRKYGLTYFLCGGSALGAVRHHGFIPWDDDIDITMPRKDYDRLRKLIKKEYPGRYWIQDIRTDKKYDINSIKVRRRGTRCVELLDPEPEKAGIFIDIYPLEDTYDNRLLRNLHGYIGEMFLLICSCVRLKGKAERILPYMKDKKSIRTVKRKVLIGSLFSFLPLNKWLRITEKVLAWCSNPDSEWVSIPSGRKHYFGEMYSRASFYPPRETDFSGHSYFIMNDPAEHLEKLYGDGYMKIPQDGHKEKHAVLEFSTGIVDEYLDSLDTK